MATGAGPRKGALTCSRALAQAAQHQFGIVVPENHDDRQLGLKAEQVGNKRQPGFRRVAHFQQAKIGCLRAQHLSQLVTHRVGVQIVAGKSG